MQKSVIWTWITSLYGFQPSSVVFAVKTPHFGPELQVSMCPRVHQSFCACKQRAKDKNKKAILFAALTCGFVHVKQRV